MLDLSYNKISRIGQGIIFLGSLFTCLYLVDGLFSIIMFLVQSSYTDLKPGLGLSNCTLIKELYLAGNKISDVEGLHRLLKLTVLDVSFNKITTTKALGQLVANYNSLQALNLLGNPIQSNISDDQLRKTVCSLLPKIAFLNKQPINPQKAREVATDAVAKAALGSGSRSSYRKGAKRVSQGGVSSTANAHKSTASVHKNKHRSKTRTHHHSKVRASDVASSSR